MRHWTLHAIAAGLAGLATVAPAMALDELKDEKDRLRACEKQLCTVVTKKAPETGDFACALTKTWHRDKIKEGTKAGNLTWGFGDARCSVDVKLDNGAIVKAVKGGDATLEFPDHSVNCIIEQEGKEPTTVKATLAPKATFKDGKVEKVWINLKEVDGPAVIKGLAFTAAKLEDNVGVLHKYLVGALNELISDKCPKVASGS